MIALLGARLVLVAAAAAEDGVVAVPRRSHRAAGGSAAGCGCRRRARAAGRRRCSPARWPPRGAARAAPRCASRNASTSGKLWPVSTCSTGNGTRRRPERLRGQVQHHDRVLAAGEQQHGPLELGDDLADDVDRLGLERDSTSDVPAPDRVGRRSRGDGKRRGHRARSAGVCMPAFGLGQAGPAAGAGVLAGGDAARCRARSRSRGSRAAPAGSRGTWCALGVVEQVVEAPRGDRVDLDQPVALVPGDERRVRRGWAPRRGARR